MGRGSKVAPPEPRRRRETRPIVTPDWIMMQIGGLASRIKIRSVRVDQTGFIEAKVTIGAAILLFKGHRTDIAKWERHLEMCRETEES